MENSTGEPDYFGMLAAFPLGQITTLIRDDIDLLASGEIMPDSAEYQKLRADILAEVVCKLTADKLGVIDLEPESYNRVYPDQYKYLEFENKMLKSLMSGSATAPKDEAVVLEGQIYQEIKNQLQPGESVSQCLQRILEENQSLKLVAEVPAAVPDEAAE